MRKQNKNLFLLKIRFIYTIDIKFPIQKTDKLAEQNYNPEKYS